MPLRLGWSFSQDTVCLTNKRGKLSYRRMMNRWLSLSLGPIFFHGVLTEYPWEMAEHRTTQGDGPRSKPALSQIELHTLSLSFLRDQHDSATKPCRPTSQLFAAPQTNSALSCHFALGDAVVEVEFGDPGPRMSPCEIYYVTVLSMSQMANTYITTHQSYVSETWARHSYTHRTQICTSKLLASFPKDQKLLPTSQGEADNCTQKLLLSHAQLPGFHMQISICTWFLW